jgi:division protein CdvB (Snf7/Vps24/ESCRT-III family)
LSEIQSTSLSILSNLLGQVEYFHLFKKDYSLSKFEKQWKSQEKESLSKRTKEVIRGPAPLKPQIQKATQQLVAEINRLDAAMSRLKQRENAIFRKTVSAVQAHDQETSKAYSSELAEIRKMQKIVTQSKIALEQVATRLQTVTDIGDFAATIAPAIGVIRKVRTSLSQAMPDAESALGEIGAQLTSIMTDIGQITGTTFYTSETSEEAQKILAEASAIAEKRMSESLPEVPAGETSYTTG